MINLNFENKSPLEIEIEWENQMTTWGIDRYRTQKAKKEELKSENFNAPVQSLMTRSIAPFEEAIIEVIKTKEKARNKGSVVSTLMLLKADEVAILTAKSILSSISSKKAFTSKAKELGSLIVEQINMNKLTKTLRKSISQKNVTRDSRKDILKLSVSSDRFSLNSDEVSVLGTFLIELFAQSTGIIKIEKEFKKQRVIEFSDLAKEKIEKAHRYNEIMTPLLLPMLVEPRDWTNFTDGGYEIRQLPLVKTNNKGYIEDNLNLPKQNVFDSINRLQKTKWQINNNVLNVLKALWEENSTLADLPSQNDLPLPSNPFDKEIHQTWENFSSEKINLHKFKVFKEELKEVIRENTRLFSKRYLVSRLIEIGETLSDNYFYYVWRMDWRGRLYPEGQLLTPQGTGLSKALLMFGEGKKINERGVYWLKINLANTYGVDKVSFEDRIKWVDEHIDLIRFSAVDPLNFRAWTEADDPWLFLASCFEYLGYLTNGYNHVTHLPINVDGSCNGLQHLSALLRDEVGATATNLIATEKPNDIYSEVAQKVEAKIKQDLIKDNSNELAQAWAGKVGRKVVKRNVMTVSYGATGYGMLEQLREDLEKDKKDVRYFLDVEKEESLFPYYQYCSKYIQEAINDTVKAAPTVMNFLQEVAEIAGQNNLPIYWETPNGFLVTQAYTKFNIKNLDTTIGNIRIRLSVGKETKQIDKNKASLAVAPNFIHSMDASHCQATINRCFNEGIENLSMIHDSYGTLANDVDKLNYYLRDEFVRMYTEKNILEDFIQQMKAQLPEEIFNKLPAIPEVGNFDIKNVYNSKYFFA